MAKNKKYEDSHFEEYFDTQTIVNVDIEKRMKEAFIDYAMSVIVSRALPDVRDGLKPVHRRILYSMFEEHLTVDKPFFKSATTVGNVIGRYHPHGDASVYDAMVRLAQDFSMRYPLIDGHGNFGSVDGDPPAAYRYTEARMSKLANVLLENIEKNTVDFVPNFDEKRKEPVVLPTRVPTLLINGSSGIAVGMATNIPPHNLEEVLDGVVAQIDNPDITVDELMDYIKGPDFPTKASIMGISGIRSAYETGRGKVIIRAKAEIEEHKDGTSSIIVTELPYQVNKKMLVESIADLVKEKKIEGLSDIDDHSSDRVGIRLEIFLKREANPQFGLNQLYKYTRLQDSFSINMLAIADGKPKTMGLKEILARFISFQEEVVTRRIRFDLEKAEARMHILEGLKIALANIDEVIHVIRNAYDDAKEQLMEKFGFSAIQAQSVLDMKLGQLQRLNGEKIDEEYNALAEKIKEYNHLLSDRDALMEQIKTELLEIRDKYGDGRMTTIEPAIDFIEDEDLIPVEENILTLTEFGYIKRQTIDTYKTQHRGGKGITGLKAREEDVANTILPCCSHDFVMFFSNKGRMFKIKAYRIPETSRTSKGMALVNLLQLDEGEKITAMIPVKEFEDDKYLIMLTKYGVIKKTVLSQYNSRIKGGLIAINLDENDELIDVKMTDGSMNIIIATHLGMAIKFEEDDVRTVGRNARGVRAMKLRGDDFIIGMEIEQEGKLLLTVSENGFGKCTPTTEYKVQSRGGMGVKNYAITEKTGNIVGIKTVTGEEDLILITTGGIVIRISSEEIRTCGRVSQGVTLIKVADETKVASIAVVDKEEEEPETVEEASSPASDEAPALEEPAQE
ncbi:MAG: DNA gyrase subunit A [Clostridia bacterium]|nr:DNA gyrase subunit A [Clostridia bacterium]